jgi:hypothetical protein
VLSCPRLGHRTWHLCQSSKTARQAPCRNSADSQRSTWNSWCLFSLTRSQLNRPLCTQTQLFEEHQHEYQQLLRPGPLKIGIQIRTGDNRMGDGTLKLKDYMHFFDCAAQIEVRPSKTKCCVCPQPVGKASWSH